MKVDFKTALKGLDGKPMMETPETPITLGSVCINVLLATFQDPNGQVEHLSSGAKVKNATLAQDIYRASEAKKASPLDLSAETITVLKERIGRGCTPLVTMRSWELLDPLADG